jgi:hypothetical protein
MVRAWGTDHDRWRCPCSFATQCRDQCQDTDWIGLCWASLRLPTGADGVSSRWQRVEATLSSQRAKVPPLAPFHRKRIQLTVASIRFAGFVRIFSGSHRHLHILPVVGAEAPFSLAQQVPPLAARYRSCWVWLERCVSYSRASHGHLPTGACW